MLARGHRIGVAVSGGADSVLLLHLLYQLTPRLELELTVLHVNHGWREVESDEDQIFVENLARALGLPILCHRSEPVGPGNKEESARLVRQRFFRQCRADHNLHRIALGHTRSDQAETVLFRMLRGTGLAGLAGMVPVTASGLIRPLLAVSREQIRAYALAHGLQWREDRSNLDQKLRRNRLRLTTLPELARSFNPNLESVLAGSAAVAATEESYWRPRIEKLYRRLIIPTSYGLTLAVISLNRLHPACQRRLLRRAIEEVRGSLRSIDLLHVESIRQICRSEHGHDRVIIPGLDAFRSFSTLLLAGPERLRQDRDYQVEVTPELPANLPFHSGRLTISGINPGERNCVTVNEESGASAMLDGETTHNALAGLPLHVRNWQPGDRFQPLGSVHPIKIKTLFQEFRILLWERRHWPVVVAGREIVWVRCFGVAAEFAATAESRSTLQLRFELSGFESTEKSATLVTGSVSESKPVSSTSL